MGWLEADDAGMGSRTANRDGDVRGQSDGRHAGSDRRRFAATRATRRAVQVPGIQCPARKQVVALDPEGEFRQIGLGQQDTTGLLHASHAGSVRIGNAPLEDGRAELGQHAGSIEAVLGREGDAMQRAELFARHDGGFGGLGSLQRVVGHGDNRIDAGIRKVNAVEVRLHHFYRRHFLRADQFSELGGVLIDKSGVHRGVSLIGNGGNKPRSRDLPNVC